jgi:hypothetical protein
MNKDLLMVSIFVFCVISGGIIARIKGDYFFRGASIAFFTCVFGVIAIIFSPRSKVRNNDEHDIHGWPDNSYLAVIGQLLLILILLL